MRKVLSVVWWGCVTVCLCSPRAQLLADPTVEEVSRLLEARGISFDAKHAGRAAVMAMICAIDPGAQLVSAEAIATEPGKKPGEAVVSESWPGGIQYMQLAAVGADTAAAVCDKLEAWSQAGQRGVILDLRKADGSSPLLVDRLAGGLAGADQTLYEVRDSTNGIVEAHAAGDAAAGAVPGALPWVVLTSRKTARDPELLAAVLKGMPGVLLVGSRTHGDAAVREALALEGGQSLLLATAWRIPASGIAYDRCGVTPDVVVAGSRAGESGDQLPKRDSSGRTLTDTALQSKALMEKVNGDACLQRAVDILLALKALPGPQRGEAGSDARAAD